MATLQGLTQRVRMLLGDLGEPFRTSAQGDAVTSWFDLPVRNIATDSTFHCYLITGAVVGSDLPTSAYTLDAINGNIQLTTPPNGNQILVVQGINYGLFSDNDLLTFINDAFNQHSANRTITTRYRDTSGFLKYNEMPLSMSNMPVVEDPMVAMLAAIEALWALTVDASTDIDVITAEGTHLPRGQRFEQLMRAIEELESKYKELCAQLNVGLFRIEQSTLRRVSKMSGRLVPVFREREYDDTNLPIRQIPPIDHRDDDESGIASPLYPQGWG